MTKASKIIIIFCMCISVGLMGIGCWLVFSDDNTNTAVVTDSQVQQNDTQITQNNQSTDNAVIQNNDNSVNTVNNTNETVANQTVTQSNGTSSTGSSSSTSTASDPSKWTQQQMLDKLTSAVNSTKASTATVTVKHTESITINITQCPGGSLVKGVITPLVNKFAQPEEETIKFVGGKGTNGDGETVTLATFPPENKQFSLPMAGVQSISAKASGSNTIITAKLKAESTTYASPIPTYNSTSIGYLNLSKIDLPSSVAINSGTFNYTGSTITATINANGLLTDIKYNLPMVVSIEGKVLTVTGTIGFTGEQNEEWVFNW